MVVIVTNKSMACDRHLLEYSRDLVKHSACCGARILGVKRDKHEIIASITNRIFDDAHHAGVAVGHGGVKLQITFWVALGEVSRDLVGQRTRNVANRAIETTPNHSVIVLKFLGAGFQDDAVENGLPCSARQIHDPLIGQKFRKIGFDGFRRWLIRGSEVNEYNGSAHEMTSLA